MDRIEKFYATHKDEFDLLEPAPDTLDWLDGQLGHRPKSSRKPWVWLAGVAAALLIACGYFFLQPSAESLPVTESPYALQVGDEFPDLMLDNQFGDAIPVSTLQGKVVLVEFWASYSKICTDRQCYYFKPIYEQYADHGFEIYGISVDTNVREWLSTVESEGLPWVNVANFDSARTDLEKKFLIQHLPTTYLLDRNGRIVAKDVGPNELEGHIERLMTQD